MTDFEISQKFALKIGSELGLNDGPLVSSYLVGTNLSMTRCYQKLPIFCKSTQKVARAIFT